MNSNYRPFTENKWKINLTAVHKLSDRFPLKMAISAVSRESAMGRKCCF